VALLTAAAASGSAPPILGADRDSAAVAAADTGTLQGRVVSRLDRRPLPATVVVLGTRLTAQTDSVGRFRIAGAPAGPHRVYVQSKGYAPETRSAVIEAGAIAELEVALEARPIPPRGHLAGWVTRDGRAAPLPHVYVSPVVVENAVRSDEDGHFEIGNLPPGWFEMRAVGLGYEERRFRILIEDARTTLVGIDLGASLAQLPPGGRRRPAPGAPGGAAGSPAAPAPGPFRAVRALADSAGLEPQAPGVPQAGSAPVRFTVPAAPADTVAARQVSVRIVDADGLLVRELGGHALAPGGYLMGWDGKDAAGSGVPPGFYRVRIEADGTPIAESLTRTP
jgi:hypothetical protein